MGRDDKVQRKGCAEIEVMLAGKVAVVTGASRGIGKSDCVKTGIRKAQKLSSITTDQKKKQKKCSEIETAGGKAVIYRCDVSDYGACEDIYSGCNKDRGKYGYSCKQCRDYKRWSADENVRRRF